MKRNKERKAFLESNSLHQFAEVEGYSGDYFVTSGGQIWSFKRNTPVLRRPGLNGGGYLQVQLSIDGRFRMHLVHRLVAEHFVDNPKPSAFKVVHHIDHNKQNNAAANLQWTTQSDNTRLWLATTDIRKSQGDAKKLISSSAPAQSWAHPDYPRLLFSEVGSAWSIKSARYLKASNTNGYLHVNSVDHHGRRHSIAIHRALYEAYHGCRICPDQIVDHIDSDKLNNHIDNLSLVSRAENARRHHSSGNRSDPRSLSSDEVFLIYQWFFVDGMSQRQIALKTRCTQSNISHLIRGLTKTDLLRAFCSKHLLDFDNLTNINRKQGRDHAIAKLGPESVLAIRHAFKDGQSMPNLAKNFGVTRSTIRSLVRGLTWKSVGGPIAAASE
jgi:hypothetical protein